MANGWFPRTNVADMSTLTKSFNSVVADFGRIDSCVTAAGIVLDKPFLEHGWDETLRVQMVNVSRRVQPWTPLPSD